MTESPTTAPSAGDPAETTACCAPAGAGCCSAEAAPAPAEDGCCADASGRTDVIGDAAASPVAEVDAALPVVVIGAGPVGLAAAAHLSDRGIPFTVLEAGDGPAAAIRQWGHVRLFSPWRFNVDPAAARLLAEAGWARPDDDKLPPAPSSSPTTSSRWPTCRSSNRTCATAHGSPP